MAVALDVVRREWQDGYRRFEDASRDPLVAERLRDHLEIVLDELRRRVGQTFTLDELAAAYNAADDWARDAISERAPTPGWPRTLAIVEATAFHMYQRGAVDYGP